MFLGQYALCKCVLIVAGQHRDGGLYDDRTMIQLRRYKMHGGPVYFHSAGQRLTMRMQAGECRQQRRMNVDDASRVALDESLAEYAHETCQHYVVWCELVDRFSKC